MNYFKKVTFIAAPIALTASLITYNLYDSPSAEEKASNLGPQSQNILVTKDFNVASNLEEMVNSSDLIAVGAYENLDSTWNMSGSPDSSEYVEGRLYNFKVEETLKGQSDETIQINHRYSETIPVEVTSGDEEISEEGILIKEASETEQYTIENKDPLFIEPEVNEQYIVFLKKGETGNYFAAVEPYLIKFNENNIAELQSNLINLDEADLSFSEEVGGQEVTVDNDIHVQVVDNLSGETFNTIKEMITEVVE